MQIQTTDEIEGVPLLKIRAYRRNRYRYYEDGEEEGNGDDVSFTAVTVDDAWQYVDEWRDTNGRVVEFGRIAITGGELLPAGALEGEPLDEKRLTEASGNEGATYARSYHRAAVVLWRQDRSVDVLLQAGVVAVLPYLKQLLAGGQHARPEAIAVAERILDAWPDDANRWQNYSMGRSWPGPADRIDMIGALIKLNAPALLERFLREALTSSYDGSENTALIDSAVVLGDAKAAAVLSILVSARMAERPNESMELCWRLARGHRPGFRKSRRPPLPPLTASARATQDRKPSIRIRKSSRARSAPNFLKTCSGP